MKKFLLLLMLCPCVLVHAQTQKVSDVLGVTHVSGNYHFTSKPFLQEGVDTIASMGSSIVKLWLTTSYVSGYGYNSNWDSVRGRVGNTNVYNTPIKSMTDLIKTGYYQAALKKSSIKTFIFVATEFYWGTNNVRSLNWKDGVSQVEHDSIVSEFKALTMYLRNNPDLANKTVILQNWEGDNHLNFDEDGARVSYQDSCIAGMIQWLNARQEGIDSGRAATPGSNVRVAGCAEFNQIPGNGRTFPYKLGIDYVVPSLHMDLYSWSNYTGSSPGTEWKIIDCLDYIKSKADTSVMFGRNNIMMGEFGCAANRRTGDYTAKDIAQREVVGRQVELALKWGVKYLVLWEIYCNGWLSSATPQEPPYNAKMNELDGFWLIRPDSVQTQTWYQFKNIMNKSLSDYQPIYQAENQPRTVSSGDSLWLMSDTSANGYYYHKLAANAVNDFVSYTLYIPRPGIYHLYVSIRKNSNCGKFQLYVDNVATSGVKDGYSASSSITSVDFGNVTFNTIGDKVLKFQVTSKHASSTGYDIILDAFRLEETGLSLPPMPGFTQGNVVVSQVGNGEAITSGNTGAVFLQEYSPTGTLTNTVAIPTTSSAARLTNSKSFLSMSLVPEGNKIVLGGYDADVNTVPGAASFRTIDRVDVNSNVLPMSLPPDSGFFASVLRGVAGNDTGTWGTGAGGSLSNGVIYTSNGSAVQLTSTINSTRVPVIFNGQLYVSAGITGYIGIYAVGTGLPTTTGQSITTKINTSSSGSGTASPYGFAFSNNGDTCYIADDRSISTGGGIQKWVYNGSAWSLAYTLSPATAAQTVGARGLAVDFSGSIPVIYATTAESGVNRLVKILDNSSSATATLIATAPTNTYFTGVCLSPYNTVLPGRMSIGATYVKSMNSIKLQWTSDNSSPSTYIIERSNDGKSFQAIGQVKADELKATTGYSFDDVNIFQPNNYYRIRVTGFKNDKYSETIKVNLPNVYSIQAFPNPFNSQFTVRHPVATKEQFIKLFAMDGKPLATKQLQQGTISTSISVTEIAGGMYKVALYNNNHQVAEVQVIKQ